RLRAVHLFTVLIMQRISEFTRSIRVRRSVTETRLRLGDFAASLQRHPLAGKTARTLMLFVVLALLPYGLPAFSRYRVLVPASLRNLIGLRAGLASDAPPIVQDGLSQPAQANDEVKASAVQAARPGEIEDPSGRALDAFFAALVKTETAG